MGDGSPAYVGNRRLSIVNLVAAVITVVSATIAVLTVTGRQEFKEAASPPAVSASGYSTLYMDSNTHGLKVSENGGDYGDLPLSNKALAWTAAQTFPASGVKIKDATGNAHVLAMADNGEGGPATFTFPPAGMLNRTVALQDKDNEFSVAQTFAADIMPNATGTINLGDGSTAFASVYTRGVNSDAGQALSLAAAQPAPAAASQAGVNTLLNASPATAGTETAGAAAGGSVVITAGNAARLTSGNAAGGNITLAPGTGIGTGSRGQIVLSAAPTTPVATADVIIGSSGTGQIPLYVQGVVGQTGHLQVWGDSTGGAGGVAHMKAGGGLYCTDRVQTLSGFDLEQTGATIRWLSGGAYDLALARSAAGVLKISNAAGAVDSRLTGDTGKKLVIASPAWPDAVNLAADPDGLSRTGTVLTIVTADAHGLAQYDIIILNATTPTTFNGTYRVETVVDVDTITVTVANAGETSGGGGSLRAQSQIQLMTGTDNFRAVAEIFYQMAANYREGLVIRGASGQCPQVLQVQTYAGEPVFGVTVGGANTGTRNCWAGWYPTGGPGDGNTTGTDNTYFGYGTGFMNHEGVNNTGFGANTLLTNTGSRNTAFGSTSICASTGGTDNTAVGYNCLYNVTGTNNVGIGSYTSTGALSGSYNILIGASAGRTMTTASANICIGYTAGYALTTSSYNVLIGSTAGDVATSQGNAMVGSGAGGAVTTGEQQVLIGWAAGDTITTGQENTIIGSLADAAATTSYAIVMGAGSTGATSSVVIGYNKDTTTANDFWIESGDVGIRRTAAATLKLTDGSTGYGSVLAQRRGVGAAQTTTLGLGVTTFAVTADFIVLTADAGANVIATITGGLVGQVIKIKFADALVTITDTGTGAADTVNLSGAFVSTANDILTLVSDGTSWFEVGRSAN